MGPDRASPGRRRDFTLLRLPSLLLPPFRDKGHERGERRRRLAAARVIQKRSGKRRAPVVEHADQRARLHAVAHIAFEGQPEADAVERGAPRQARIVRDQLPGGAHLDDAAGLLELPVRHRAAAEADADADMIEQILRMLRPAMLRDIFAATPPPRSAAADRARPRSCPAPDARRSARRRRSLRRRCRRTRCRRRFRDRSADRPARNGATIGASTRSIAGGGALMRRRPDGTPRRPRT